MLKFIGGYITVAFAVLYTFQLLEMIEIGDYAMFVGMLVLTFILRKDGKIKEIIASNICLLAIIVILWFSNHTFRYIQNTSMLLIFIGAMLIAELFGGLWGRKFARDQL
ncbi:hypothetical protein FACS1894192_08330 [Bacilli bacterium]|nr:hypothetical protein FACS1894192_08330 [Bacilli bacterium]